jgi:O-methyltransferase involved in polyketide biosynthesis
MSDLMYCTEAEVKQILLELAAETDEAPYVFVATREQKRNSLNRMVTFVIQTKEGNEALVNKVVSYSAHNEMALRFLRSDVNIQNGNFATDFIFVEATISPKL